MSEYFGRYRGKVVNNADPEQRGRLMVSVSGVTGSGQLNWALPSMPFAGSGVGLFALPPVGANVWVEYEGGDAEHPIWCGCFWGENDQVPASPAVSQQVVLKTQGCTLTLSDLPGPAGGVKIELSSGMKITLSSTALEITNGSGASIKLEQASVKLNNDALEVT